MVWVSNVKICSLKGAVLRDYCKVACMPFVQQIYIFLTFPFKGLSGQMNLAPNVLFE
jgi:hypothetical protein